MSKVVVHRAGSGKAAIANPFPGKVDDALELVRRRAFELFEKRGREPGSVLTDWLQAERDLFFVPRAEMAETGKGFRMKISAPGLHAADIEVIALPRELLVEAQSGRRLRGGNAGAQRSEPEFRAFYRRFEFNSPIDVDNVVASIDRGQLIIEAPKEALVQPIPGRAAAA
jgi:HSP20 family molecular chaperone IbpA